jgi:hypothetical protein
MRKFAEDGVGSAGTFNLYFTLEELRYFRSRSSNPTRARGRAYPPSLTLRVTFEMNRVQNGTR